jgi:uncharacterized membrane protein YfcA
MWILYLLLAFAATALGSLAGMGGGVFIKPILDFLGKPDAASVSVLSSAAVFTMACIAQFAGRKNKEKPALGVSVPISVGAVAGGVLGERLFAAIISNASSTRVKATQNAILIFLIIFVFLYMMIKERVNSFAFRGIPLSLATGLALGLISSFLGIGGGPINVALIEFLFAYSAKMAMQCSLMTILFSQAAKLAMVALVGNFSQYDLSFLPAMLAGGAMGGILGGSLNKKLTDKSSSRLFCAAQIAVVCICVANIILASENIR